MTDTTDAAYTVTMKAGGGFEAPWLVIRGDTAAEVNERLRQVFSENLGGAVIATAEAFQAEYKPQAAPAQSPAVQAVVGAVDGTVIASGPTTPAPSSPAPQAPAAGQGVETDKWGGTYEWNHAGAPTTQFGPKVLKRAISQNNKPYAQWIDPRSKKIPSVYRANGGQDPVDLLEPEFAQRGI